MAEDVAVIVSSALAQAQLIEMEKVFISIHICIWGFAVFRVGFM